MKWKKFAFRILRSLPGIVLAIIGLGGVADDLRTWQDWLTGLITNIFELESNTLRWIFVIAGVVIGVIGNLPWSKFWRLLKYGRTPREFKGLMEQAQHFMAFTNTFLKLKKYDKISKGSGYKQAERQLRRQLEKDAVIVQSYFGRQERNIFTQSIPPSNIIASDDKTRYKTLRLAVGEYLAKLLHRKLGIMITRMVEISRSMAGVEAGGHSTTNITDEDKD